MQLRTRKYQSYLLRIWNEGNDGEWHATLQDVFSSDCYHFPSLYKLYVKLCELTQKYDAEDEDWLIERLGMYFWGEGREE